MRYFETEKTLSALSLPQMFKDEFAGLLGTINKAQSDELITERGKFALYHLSNGNLQEAGDDVKLLFHNMGAWKFPRRWTLRLLESSELVCISRVLHHIFPQPGFIPDINHLPKTTKCYKSIEFRGELFSVHNDTKYGRHSYILANWAGDGGDINTSHTHSVRPGRIQRIIQYKFSIGTKTYSIAIARIEWYKSHPRKNMYGVGLQLWNRSSFEDHGPASYLPMHCIQSKFAPAYGSITNNQAATSTAHESVLFICPLRSNNFL